MTVRFQVTFDSGDPAALARFWGDVLGYVEQPPPAGYGTWEQWMVDMDMPEERWDSVAALVDPSGALPRIYIQKVPEPKTAKNRVHLDVNCGGEPGTPSAVRRARVDAEVERLVALGATKLNEGGEFGEYYVVMHDPDGNEFCLQ